ncbi:cupin domain-containing protein [Ornithinibacillus halophilus]|uniref:Cupin domain-containing protein n=1 Tax=Ornithinibacillus halophilus TaxID=930117 RepID=A0A1M5NQ67_9BACI|nr:hypothetical protein [Ornithinibacillus halophilus]SHG91339.1 hypothetical protein SAMN05216225_10863 [Ornithinibacillus halophilus]
MSGIKKITSKEISESLEGTNRQYLVGNLKKPQLLKHIFDENIEVGISHYKTFTADEPHFHSTVTEYQYVINGSSKIKNLLTNEIIDLEAGDFYIVNTKTPYAQKSMPDTKILFFKHPGINDKVPIEVDQHTINWLNAVE